MKLRTIKGKFWADVRVDGRRLRKCLGADRELAELRMTSVERFERVARMMKGDPLFAKLLRAHVKSPHAPSTVGHVYFVRAGDRVKIGFARVLKRRLTQIQVSLAEPVQLAKSVRGTRAVEREMHARFAAYRVRGEWFRCEGELLDFIGGSTWASVGITEKLSARAVAPSDANG